VVFEDKEANPAMLAVSKDFPDADGYILKTGRFFTDADYEQFRPVAILDQFLTDRLFPDQPAIGRWIYVEGRPFAVVGIVPTQKTTEEPEGVLIIPLAIHSAVTGRRSVSSIQVRPHDLRNLEALGKLAKDLLKQRRPGRQLWDYNNSEDIVAKQKTLDLAAQALTVVAVISLLIGGVGIANVMIGSVIERTPEIGLRRAIGATKQDVMLQFILEAAVLSLVGGTIALATVHSATLVISNQFKLPYKFDWNAGAIALSSALIVGIGAGLPAALRASQLDPVKALQAQ
jgi:putative ABC transport system permease protein